MMLTLYSFLFALTGLAVMAYVIAIIGHVVCSEYIDFFPGNITLRVSKVERPYLRAYYIVEQRLFGFFWYRVSRIWLSKNSAIKEMELKTRKHTLLRNKKVTELKRAKS